jgi:hypothetical protein
MAENENTNPIDAADEAAEKENQDYESPEEAMRRYHITLTNAPSDPGIMAELKKFNYDEARLKQGAGLLAKTVGLYAEQKKEYGEQIEASEEFRSLWVRSKAAYNDTLQIARTAFASDGNAYTALMLAGKRKVSKSGWSEQALTLYRNLLATPAFMEKIGYFGYTRDKLDAEQRMVMDVIAADARHKKEMGESQEATEVRDNSFEELSDWMSKFYVVAKIALASKPQWLEKLGIKQ